MNRLPRRYAPRNDGQLLAFCKNTLKAITCIESIDYHIAEGSRIYDPLITPDSKKGKEKKLFQKRMLLSNTKQCIITNIMNNFNGLFGITQSKTLAF